MAVLIIAGGFFNPRWQKSEGEALLSWEAGGYYWYLPSVFIYQDLKGQGFKDSILHKYQMTPAQDFQYGYKLNESGSYILRYPFGLAILELPYFFIAHIWAPMLGYPADGFSLPYQFMIFVGGMLIAFIGLYYLRRFLLAYFLDRTVAISLLLLTIGTNYLNFAGIEVGLSQTWLFTLYTLLLWNTHRYYTSYKRKHIICLGALIGLLILINPTEVISALIPTLWGIERPLSSSFQKRLVFWKSKKQDLIPAVFITLIIICTLLVYGKWVADEWIIFNYWDWEYSWLRPHFFQYAFNVQTGWLRHTPLMLIVIPSILLYIFKGSNRWALLGYAFIHYYIVSCSQTWDYIGRAMIQSYPVLFIFIAYFIEWISKRIYSYGVATH